MDDVLNEAHAAALGGEIKDSRRQCSVSNPIRIKALAVGRLSIVFTNAGGSWFLGAELIIGIDILPNGFTMDIFFIGINYTTGVL